MYLERYSRPVPDTHLISAALTRVLSRETGRVNAFETT